MLEEQRQALDEKEAADLTAGAPLTELCTSSAATAAVFQPLFGGPIDIQGPPNTPYAGGAFLVFFDFPSKYPHESPRVRWGLMTGG